MNAIHSLAPKFICTLVGAWSLLFQQTQAALPSIEWTHQWGTSGWDEGLGVSIDGRGNLYITGFADGSLGGTNVGGYVAFLSKYDSTGDPVWTQQLGTSGYDLSLGVSADELGNVYITGRTQGSLAGPNAGSADAFVSKYDATGSLAWTRQFGTAGDDVGQSASIDGLGNVYITGYTQGSLAGPNVGSADAFVSKYDSTGVLAWTQQFGTTGGDLGLGVSADGLGNVYITGRTQGSLVGTSAGEEDAFLSMYDATGTQMWIRQLGTSGWDEGFDVSADGLGNVYISGSTRGSLGGSYAGRWDAFIAKYDAGGILAWTHQLGTSSEDGSLGVSTDGLGNVYITGRTQGSLGGPTAGSHDAFVSKFDAAGTLAWTQQWGTRGSDVGRGVSADGLGNVYITGATTGSLGGVNLGGYDTFLTKFRDTDVVPEPSALLFLKLIGLGIVAWRHGRKYC